MSNLALANLSSKLAERFGMGTDGDVVSILKATAFKGPATDAQLIALMVVAQQYSLNPFTKEIYAFPDRNNGIVPVVGVDGWSRIINSHAQFDGMDFEQDEQSCSCIIHRKDRNHPTRVTEYLSECKRDVAPWKSHPRRMLRHKAMIQCARLAFGYSGIFDQDEAERIVENKTGMPTVEPEALVDVAPLIAGTKATTTDAEAAKYWADNNGKLKNQPQDHAAFKQAVIDHRTALREANVTDVEAREVTQ